MTGSARSGSRLDSPATASGKQLRANDHVCVGFLDGVSVGGSPMPLGDHAAHRRPYGARPAWLLPWPTG